MTATDRAVELTRVAAEAADAKQAVDIVALDVSGTMPLTDVFLLATGRNERQVLSIAEEIEDELQQRLGQKAVRREGREEGRWVLLDFGDLVAHVFHEEDRMYYGLERIWADAPSIPLDVEGAANGSSGDSSPAGA